MAPSTRNADRSHASVTTHKEIDTHATWSAAIYNSTHYLPAHAPCQDFTMWFGTVVRLEGSGLHVYSRIYGSSRSPQPSSSWYSFMQVYLANDTMQAILLGRFVHTRLSRRPHCTSARRNYLGKTVTTYSNVADSSSIWTACVVLKFWRLSFARSTIPTTSTALSALVSISNRTSIRPSTCCQFRAGAD